MDLRAVCFVRAMVENDNWRAPAFVYIVPNRLEMLHADWLISILLQASRILRADWSISIHLGWPGKRRSPRSGGRGVLGMMCAQDFGTVGLLVH